MGQLGLKVQHALRAFTPKDQKAVKTVAETFRSNPDLDTKDVITQLGVGEALVSTLDEEGIPTQVERILIRPPESRIGPMNNKERQEQIDRSPYRNRYDQVLDRESAYEVLAQRAENIAAKEEQLAKEEAIREAQEEQSKSSSKSRRRSNRQTPTEAFVKSAARAIGSQLGRKVIRGLLGSLFRG